MLLYFSYLDFCFRYSVAVWLFAVSHLAPSSTLVQACLIATDLLLLLDFFHNGGRRHLGFLRPAV